jgi:hypothetical protein
MRRPRRRIRGDSRADAVDGACTLVFTKPAPDAIARGQIRARRTSPAAQVPATRRSGRPARLLCRAPGRAAVTALRAALPGAVSMDRPLRPPSAPRVAQLRYGSGGPKASGHRSRPALPANGRSRPVAGPFDALV